MVVIGAGVIGLSSAVRLLEQGYEVEVWAAGFPPETTSNIAAAFWMPYAAAPVDEVKMWAQASYQAYRELSSLPGAGITPMPALEILRGDQQIPEYNRALPGLRTLDKSELPSHIPGGYTFDSFVIDTRDYMPFLCERAEEFGAYLVQKKLNHFDEAFAKADLVVNCSGLGARELAGDSEVYASRGQIVRIAKQPIDRVLGDDHNASGLTYIVPRKDDCILGGSYEQHQESLEPQAALTESIMQRCQEIEPRLEIDQPLEVIVGLRPCRNSIRVERLDLDGGKTIIHNYGHGGSGITLSWGCADAVAKMANDWLTGGS